VLTATLGFLGFGVVVVVVVAVVVVVVVVVLLLEGMAGPLLDDLPTLVTSCIDWPSVTIGDPAAGLAVVVVVEVEEDVVAVEEELAVSFTLVTFCSPVPGLEVAIGAAGKPVSVRFLFLPAFSVAAVLLAGLSC